MVTSSPSPSSSSLLRNSSTSDSSSESSSKEESSKSSVVSISLSFSVEKLKVSSETILLKRTSNGFLASLTPESFLIDESTSDVNSSGASSAFSTPSTSSGPEPFMKDVTFFSLSLSPKAAPTFKSVLTSELGTLSLRIDMYAFVIGSIILCCMNIYTQFITILYIFLFFM